MKVFTYLYYFFYVGINWNFRIAWHITRLEIKGEKKYGINTTGVDELKKLDKEGTDTSHATIYMPVSYSVLDLLFKELPTSPRQHFFDIGCGKGRAICVAAHHGYHKVSGIDFSESLCEDAKKNVALTTQKIPGLKAMVSNMDAVYLELPADVDCVFLFNPFDVVIMGAVVSNIIESLELHPRPLLVAYANPMYKDLFIDEGFEEIFHSKEFKYLEICIMQKR